MNHNKIRLYGKLLRFKKGQLLSLFLTFKCNLRCSYCSLKWATDGIWPKTEISTVRQWQDLINRISFPIREISLLGGEPTLYPGFAELTNWLLSRGYFVKVYTNLTNPNVLLEVNRSQRFIIHASYHRAFDGERFMANYYSLYKKHRIDIYELGYRTLNVKTRLGPILSKRDHQAKTSDLHISPDRRLYWNCDEMCLDKK